MWQQPAPQDSDSGADDIRRRVVAWLLLGWLALVIMALAGWAAVARSRIAAERADLARIRAKFAAA